MTIYTLLRLLVQGLGRTGGLTSEQVFDAIQLISELEQKAQFGSLATSMIGKHQYRDTNTQAPGQCAFCHKTYNECEGDKD